MATSRAIDVGYATVRATRLTYVGELGWELYVPVEFAIGVYEALMAAGKDLGIANAGYYAIDSLRLEKGYRAWGRELSPDINPYEAGLGFAVRLDKPGGFRGRDALAALDPRDRQAAHRFTGDRCAAYERLGRRIDSARRQADRLHHVGGFRAHDREACCTRIDRPQRRSRRSNVD